MIIGSRTTDKQIYHWFSQLFVGHRYFVFKDEFCTLTLQIYSYCFDNFDICLSLIIFITFASLSKIGEFFPNVPTSPYIVDNYVNLFLMNNDPINPSVQNGGNMSFSVINTGEYQTNDFEFVIKLAAHLDAVNDTIYELVVDINDVVKIAEFTVWGYFTLNVGEQLISSKSML